MVTNVKIVQKALITFDNKLLVVRRSPKDETRPDCWDFPGGNVDDDDVKGNDKNILLNALSREIKEEIDLIVDPKNLQAFFVNDGWKNDKGSLFIWIAYKTTLSSEPKIKLSPEHIEYKWIESSELSQINFGPNELFLKVGKIIFS